MKSLPSYTTPSYIGALRTHQSHKHPSRVWRRRCGHTCTRCVWQKQRVARQQHLAFFVKLFGLLHLAVFLCITALQVSDPHPLSAYRRVHDYYSMRPSSREAIKGRQRRRNSWARLPPGVEGWEPWHGYITRSTICNLCNRVKSRLASSSLARELPISLLLIGRDRPCILKIAGVKIS